MIFEQILTGFYENFSYLIADEQTKEGVIVDPSFEPQNILPFIKDIKIKYIINTHSHEDHIKGNSFIQEKTNAKILHYPEIKEGDIIKIGKLKLKIIHTPGHSPDGICILIENKLLTGDTLFVGNIGGTGPRFEESSEKELYDSLTRLIKLPDKTEIWPGHDYGNTTFSTIAIEKKENIMIRHIMENHNKT